MNLLIGSIDCLLCAVKRSDNEICNEYERVSDITTIDLFDIADFVPEFHSPKVRELKDRYRGKRCFLIGNGPSLRIEDLDKLHEHHEITFACNKIYNVFRNTEWRPDFYVMMDVWVLRSDTRNILNVTPKTTTVGPAIQRIIPELKNKISSFSYRTPTQIVASADMSVVLSKESSKSEIIELLNQIESQVVSLNTEDIISIDCRKSSFSSIVDTRWVTVEGNKLKLITWYDNEWGYCSRVIDLISKMDF